MNVKRILTLATAAAIAILATPAANASTTSTGTVTVKWNTQAIGSVVVHADYNATGQGGNTGNTTPTVYTATNGGAGSCTATGGGIPANDTTADFSSVTPDSTDTTDCLYKNGANALVSTSDSSGYSVAISAAVPANFALCLLPNGAYANNGAVTTSARSAAVAGITTTATTCTGAPGNGYNMAASANLISTAAATAGTNLGGDINLAIAPNAGSGAQSVTVTYTMTMN